VLIASGNLSFLNWLTIVPIIACFDDDALLALVPRRARRWIRARLDARPSPPAADAPIAIAFVIVLAAIAAWICSPLALRIAIVCGAGIAVTVPSRARSAVASWLVASASRLRGRDIAMACFAALVAYKSVAVIDNLAGPRQLMNASFDRLALVNTYGAFGSVDDTRHELVIEGTLADDPSAPDATWRAYELPCKPGDPARRPCLLGPYHLRLDWVIWFWAMEDRPRELEAYYLAWKLLDGDRAIRRLLAVDPFDGTPPRWLRIRRFVYRFADSGDDAWWNREEVFRDPDDDAAANNGRWMEPVSRESEVFRRVFAQYGWPSPSDTGHN
jgi:hypothetical protein